MKVYAKHLDQFFSIKEEDFPKWGERIINMNTEVTNHQFLSHLDMEGWRLLQNIPPEEQTEAFGILNFSVLRKENFVKMIQGFKKRMES